MAERVTKILLTGDTGTGKTTLAKAIIRNIDPCKAMKIIAVDDYRKKNGSIDDEYSAKMKFVADATKPSDAIIECAGVGLTATILLASIRDLIEAQPCTVIVFNLQPRDHSPKPGRLDPKLAVYNFREFSPVVITHTEESRRLRVVRRILKQRTT